MTTLADGIRLAAGRCIEAKSDHQHYCEYVYEVWVKMDFISMMTDHLKPPPVSGTAEGDRAIVSASGKLTRAAQRDANYLEDHRYG
jgi:hypothetical protein